MELLLIIKLVVAMGVVVGLSLIAEFGNAKLAGILSAYPLGTAIVLFFFGWEVSPDFAAQSAVFSLPGFVGMLVFLTAYWQASGRWGGLTGVFVSAGAALAAFIAVSAVFQSIDFSLLGAIAIAVGAMAAFGWLFKRIENVNVGKRVPLSGAVLLFRGGMAAAVVIAITGMAEILGPEWSGLFAGFPITLFPLLLVLHVTYGKDPVHTVIKNFPIGLGSLITYSISVSLTYTHFGIGIGTLISFVIATVYLLLFMQVVKFLTRRLSTR